MTNWIDVGVLIEKCLAGGDGHRFVAVLLFGVEPHARSQNMVDEILNQRADPVR